MNVMPDVSFLFKGVSVGWDVCVTISLRLLLLLLLLL